MSFVGRCSMGGSVGGSIRDSIPEAGSSCDHRLIFPGEIDKLDARCEEADRVHGYG